MAEDDVEADPPYAARGQAVDHSGPEGSEEYAWGRGEFGGREAVMVDRDDSDRLAADTRPHPMARQRQVIEEPVDSRDRDVGRQARPKGETRGQDRCYRAMVPPRRSYARRGEARSVDAQPHQRAARARCHRDKAVLDGVGLIAHLHTEYIAMFCGQHFSSRGLGRAAIDQVEAKQRALALVRRVNGGFGYPVGAPPSKNDLGVDRQSRRQIARNPPRGSPPELIDAGARTGLLPLALAAIGKIAGADLKCSASHGDELAFAIVEEG